MKMKEFQQAFNSVLVVNVLIHDIFMCVVNGKILYGFKRCLKVYFILEVYVSHIVGRKVAYK